MKVLLDSCVAPLAAEVMRQAGHDATWAGEWPKDPGDAEIFRVALSESRVLVTIDKDFGELAIVHYFARGADPTRRISCERTRCGCGSTPS